MQQERYNQKVIHSATKKEKPLSLYIRKKSNALTQNIHVHDKLKGKRLSIDSYKRDNE